MKQKVALKHTKKLRKQINGKFNNIGYGDENKQKISVQQFLPLSEAEIQGLHPVQANLGHFFAWF
jgi:hypothetical protein